MCLLDSLRMIPLPSLPLLSIYLSTLGPVYLLFAALVNSLTCRGSLDQRISPNQCQQPTYIPNVSIHVLALSRYVLTSLV